MRRSRRTPSRRRPWGCSCSSPTARHAAAARSVRTAVPLSDRDARSRAHARAAAQLHRIDGVHVRRAPRSRVHRQARHDGLGDGLHAGKHRGSGRAASGLLPQPARTVRLLGDRSTATRRSPTCAARTRNSADAQDRRALDRARARLRNRRGHDRCRTAIDPRIRASTSRAIRWRSLDEQFRVDDDLAAS